LGTKYTKVENSFQNITYTPQEKLGEECNRQGEDYVSMAGTKSMKVRASATVWK